MTTKTILFIHGMFMTPLCWENWLPHCAAHGYDCQAPAWPGRDAAVAELRQRHPDPELGNLNLTQIVDHYTTLIGQMPAKPIIIGHSMGGLVSQILLGRGLAAAVVAIDSAPPAGVFSPAWSFLKANWPMVNPFIPASRPHLMTPAQFQYAFVNTLAPDAQQAAYDRYVVPESRRVPRESLGGIGRLDFKKAHAPLLLVAGGADHIIPAALNRANSKKYRHAGATTDFIEFPGRSHFIIGQDGWQEVADHVLKWLAGLERPPVSH